MGHKFFNLEPRIYANIYSLFIFNLIVLTTCVDNGRDHMPIEFIVTSGEQSSTNIRF